MACTAVFLSSFKQVTTIFDDLMPIWDFGSRLGRLVSEYACLLLFGSLGACYIRYDDMTYHISHTTYLISDICYHFTFHITYYGSSNGTESVVPYALLLLVLQYNFLLYDKYSALSTTVTRPGRLLQE